MEDCFDFTRAITVKLDRVDLPIFFHLMVLLALAVVLVIIVADYLEVSPILEILHLLLVAILQLLMD